MNFQELNVLIKERKGNNTNCKVYTLLLLIFAGLNFRDFQVFQKVAELKTCENLF